ncbi:hypothetical protein E2493_20785 [Sphingomonas parva]|uniref:Uncharacterized protein n=1 Tax=Sphingomonas parva TaxID=2555898 RepID=A0A4Y8ZJZ2_9SPHN|nr:hypothetical protein [Sphingomonas parva]TFI56320.1 hypothetical protein E2493_20785 [Sphingomonas parva]
MTLRRGARICGTIVFALLEGAGLLFAFVVSSIRCCAIEGDAAPGGAGWEAFAVLAVLVSIAAAVAGLATALLAEGVARLGAWAWRRRMRP